MWVIVSVFLKAGRISHKINQDPTKWAAVLKKSVSRRGIRSNSHGVST